VTRQTRELPKTRRVRALTTMTKKSCKVVFSTDPDGGLPSPFAALGSLTSQPQPAPPSPSPSQPAKNPAAAVPALQGNTAVRVGRERKGRGGKTVSIISGVMSRETGQQALLKLLKSKLGAGGALEDGAIIIQGDHRERIVEILNDLGYKAKVAGG
jgi:translation initiation factor 1